MIIENFEIRALHGLIDAELTFRPDLNIIVGRNGSGKTSVLSMLSSVIRLDIGSIKAMSFDSLSMMLDSGAQGKILIEAENSEFSSHISINWVGVGSVKFPLIDPDIFLRPNARIGLRSAPTSATGVGGDRPTFELYQQWSQISTAFLRLAKLTFVGSSSFRVEFDSENPS